LQVLLLGLGQRQRLGSASRLSQTISMSLKRSSGGHDSTAVRTVCQSMQSPRRKGIRSRRLGGIPAYLASAEGVLSGSIVATYGNEQILNSAGTPSSVWSIPTRMLVPVNHAISG
jgi:hypothetical protein